MIRARLSASAGAVALAALNSAVGVELDEQWMAARTSEVLAGTSPTSYPPTSDVPAGSPPPDERPSTSQRRADGLVDLAEAWLAAAAQDSKSPIGGVRHEVLIHVDAAVLADDSAGGVCHAEGAGALIPEEVRRFACDGDIRVAALASNGT